LGTSRENPLFGVRLARCAVVTRQPYDPYDPFNSIFNTALMLRTMRIALKDAAVSLDQISSLGTDGSSNVFYHSLEAITICELLGERAAIVPVYSIKEVTGQTSAVMPSLRLFAIALSLKRASFHNL
jgi:3-oxoacyl-(acyl-carrier-protein) synthase